MTPPETVNTAPHDPAAASSPIHILLVEDDDGDALLVEELLAVNLSGAFILGLLGSNFILGTGFVGAYTTFSTWMLETDQLPRNRAVLNIVGSLALGMAAAGLGISLRQAG